MGTEYFSTKHIGGSPGQPIQPSYGKWGRNNRDNRDRDNRDRDRRGQSGIIADNQGDSGPGQVCQMWVRCGSDVGRGLGVRAIVC